MEIIESILTTLDSYLGGAFYFPYVLLGVGVFFSIYLGLPQVRFFSHAWKVLLGKYSKSDDPGDTTHFQALSTALSGTVGTGNIGGVAFALYLGGPAALFWMWATAFLGMTTKYVEVSVSHKYRQVDENGHMVGGPMNYMEGALNLKWLAVFFAIATVVSSFGSGNMPQANNIAAGLESSFSVPTYVTGILLAAAMGMVIIGGIARIAKVAATLVPFMGILYALAALLVIVNNYENILPSLGNVISDAFTGSAAVGGFLGASFAYAFNRGVNRGLFSNEAGQGSAPIAHASAKTKEPAAEGMVAILEPFIDTLVICTLTALVILSSGVWQQKFENDFGLLNVEVINGVYNEQNPAHVQELFTHLDIGSTQVSQVKPFNGTLNVVDGQLATSNVTVIHNRSIAEDIVFRQQGSLYSGAVEVNEGSIAASGLSLSGQSLIHSVALTAKAFQSSFLGVFGEYVVTVGLTLFAFTTAIAWSYYGDRAITYLFGVRWVLPYRVLYVLGFFVATIADTELVWKISYVTVALMTLPNLFGLMLMHKEVKSMTHEYWQKHKS